MIGPALLDANVLFPQLLRDVLVSLSAGRAFEARWTNQIHHEWTRNVLKQRPDIAPGTLDQVRALMNKNVPGCLVEDFEPLIETLDLPDANDRHVWAAAIEAQATIIVTLNLKDFPERVLAAYGIRPLSPDVFLCEVLADETEKSLVALAKQRRRFQRPALSAEKFLEELARQRLTRFFAALEPFKDQL